MPRAQIVLHRLTENRTVPIDRSKWRGQELDGRVLKVNEARAKTSNDGGGYKKKSW